MKLSGVLTIHTVLSRKLQGSQDMFVVASSQHSDNFSHRYLVLAIFPEF